MRILEISRKDIHIEFMLWEQRVAGSNPVTPTENQTVTKVAVFLLP